MNQRTHAWIGVRAIALLEDENKSRELVRLLKPHAAKAAIGAWIPDLTDAKRGGGQVQHHVLKMEPVKKGTDGDRFVADKSEMVKRIGAARLMSEYLADDTTLSPSWWQKPYRGYVRHPGQHVANRAMALATMLRDLLIIGDPDVDGLIAGKVRFIDEVPAKARTRCEQAAVYFFIISHFMADACMPCHCDARHLAGYAAGLHMEMEKHWSKSVGTRFDKKKLGAMTGGSAPDSILKAAREVDAEFDVPLAHAKVPLLKNSDIWLEVVNLCRGSFALNSIIAPPRTYPYGRKSKKKAPFEKVLGEANPALMADIDRVVMHDAVVSTAMAWKHIWEKVKVN